MTSHENVLSADSLLQYEPFVRTVVRSLLSNEDQVRDVVQETWLRAIDRPPRGSIKSWLARVARNLARDHHRGEGRRRAREEAVARRETSVEASSARLEAHRSVVDAVLKLPEPYKTVVLLSYYDGLSPAKIAARLDRKPVTIRSQLHRAHEMLREKLDTEYGDRAAWAGIFLPWLEASRTVGLPSSLVVKLALAAAACIVPLALLPSILRSDVAGSAPRSEDSVAVTDPPSIEERATSEPAVASSSSERVPAASGLTVVVEREGTPVADAEVWLLEVANVNRREVEENADLLMALDAVFRRFGERATTDARGEVRFDRPEGDAALLATTPGHLGVVEMRDLPEDRATIVLEEVSEVRVRVVDASGRAVAGVPVALIGGTSEQTRSMLRRAETARDGSVLFRDFARGIEWSEPGEPTYSVELVVPGSDVEVAVDSTRRPRDEVTLELGPTGSVEVRTVDEDGEPITLDGRASVQEPGWSQTNQQRAPLRGGTAHFAYVGLGEELEITVQSPEKGVEWKALGAGPTLAGETVRIDVRSPGRPRITGRVLGRDGHPLAKRRLYVIVRSEQRASLQQIEVDTDGDGRFGAELGEKVEVDSSVLVSVLTFANGRWQDRVDVEALHVKAGTTELGDLHLGAAEGFLEGRVVDLSGAPVAGIEVSAALDYDRSSTVARTDDEGRFSITGFLPREVDLDVPRSEWVLVEPKTVPRGSKDLTIRVTRGGRIAGSVLVGEGVPTSGLTFVVYASGAKASGAGWNAYVRVEDDGSFLASGLATGSYTCKLFRPGASLFQVENVLVRASETTRDPRLQAIDLAGAMRTVTFTVETEDGKRVAAMVTAEAGGETVGYCNSRGDGRVELAFPTDREMRIVVRQPGYRNAVVDLDELGDKVVLRRGIEVVLHTQQRPRIRSGDANAQLSFVLESGGGLVASVPVPSTLATQGHAVVGFPGPGRYRLHVSIDSDAGGGMRTVSQATPRDTVVEVREGDEGKDLDVTLPERLFDE